ncbi:hypothetical protein TSOC_004510 [Tetrabaena socialis]|uniref:Uncharacterized protein n=1 Tax=Tetrabaena socialis TaxID=47790 RepID=A0A2J8A8R2_9CHLO|nr:hypothetical protein TSOC_004510 [Tetrabaena socialis]|eukprot:PNH08924.1 hypothetical protein TSOC_004510 [Tetrabaena socialis]
MDVPAACPALYLLLLLLAAASAPCRALRVDFGATMLTARELLAWAGPLPNGILSLVPETRDGQDLTLTSLCLFLVELPAPLGYQVNLPTLALASLFAVPAGARLLLQDVVVVLAVVDLYSAMNGICSIYDTDAFPYSPGVVVEGGVVHLIDHTSWAPDENGTAGAGGEVRWINVTLTCPGYGSTRPACAARPIREGWELDAAVLQPMLEATEGPVMLSLAPDVALPAGGSWAQVMVPAGRLLVLIGDPSLQLRRGRKSTLDLGGVEGAWVSLGMLNGLPPSMAHLRDLQLVNLPYSSMPRESLGLLALSMQSFGLTWCVHARNASGQSSNHELKPQLRVSRCTLVVSDPELAFLARAAAASVSGLGQPNLTALFGDGAGQVQGSGLGQPNLTALFGDGAGQPRVGGGPLMDGAEGSLLLEFLQLRSLVAFTDVTLVSASHYSGTHRNVSSFAALPGPPPLLPSALVWPPLLIHDKNVALQWGSAGTLMTSTLEEALLAVDSCGQAPSGRTVIVLSSTDDQSVPPVVSGTRAGGGGSRRDLWTKKRQRERVTR